MTLWSFEIMALIGMKIPVSKRQLQNRNKLVRKLTQIILFIYAHRYLVGRRGSWRSDINDIKYYVHLKIESV